jgi:oxysterol-binding protein-related protein 3/6/7
LPITDSRNRPDQRLFENGKIEEAEHEKHRIEEMQRTRRRALEEKGPGSTHQPLWFLLDTSTNSSKDDWVFTNQYWQKRENPEFKNLRKIFPVLW